MRCRPAVRTNLSAVRCVYTYSRYALPFNSMESPSTTVWAATGSARKIAADEGKLPHGAIVPDLISSATSARSFRQHARRILTLMAMLGIAALSSAYAMSAACYFAPRSRIHSDVHIPSPKPARRQKKSFARPMARFPSAHHRSRHPASRRRVGYQGRASYLDFDK